MAGSTFGTLFRITTWGESHGPAMGVVVDGCPAGLPLNEDDIQKVLHRRRPGQSPYSTPRRENDTVQILSGVYEGRTTGAPISLLVPNRTQRSTDYNEIATYYRPGHADYSFDAKYGFRDFRGGGRSSGRETTGRVAGGAIAMKILELCGIHITAYVKAIGGIFCETIDPAVIESNPFRMADLQAAEKVRLLVEQAMADHDSLGGIIECVVEGLPAGLGEPVFDKLDGEIGKAIFSIGAVKGLEIGDGFAVSSRHGSENNDAFTTKDGKVTKRTNHAGGVLGGISDGDPFIFRAAFKPTPSIFRTQQTINQAHEEISVNIEGRHDPLIVPRAVVVVEAMTALTLTDLLLRGMGAKLSSILTHYQD